MTKPLFTASTAELCAHIQLGERTIRKLRQEGVLQAGRHYRHMGTGTVRPRLRWNVEAVDEALTNRSRRLKVGA